MLCGVKVWLADFSRISTMGHEERSVLNKADLHVGLGLMTLFNSLW